MGGRIILLNRHFAISLDLCFFLLLNIIKALCAQFNIYKHHLTLGAALETIGISNKDAQTTNNEKSRNYGIINIRNEIVNKINS